MTCGFCGGPPDHLRDRKTTLGKWWQAGFPSRFPSATFKILGYHMSAMFNLVVETVETLIPWIYLNILVILEYL